jgi:hypothetical protein
MSCREGAPPPPPNRSRSQNLNAESIFFLQVSACHTIFHCARICLGLYSVQCINFCESSSSFSPLCSRAHSLSPFRQQQPRTHTYVPQPAQQWMMYGAILYALEKLFSRFVPAESTLCSLTWQIHLLCVCAAAAAACVFITNYIYKQNGLMVSAAAAAAAVEQI